MKKIHNHIWRINADVNNRSNYNFFETDDGKYCIYFEKINEYGMMKFVSPVQIWTNKENPKQVFQSQTNFEYQFSRSCYYLSQSDLIVLLSPCEKQKQLNLLYVLLDLNKQQFSIVNAPNFDLKEIDPFKVQYILNDRYYYDSISSDHLKITENTILDLSELTSHHFDKLGTICQQQ